MRYQNALTPSNATLPLALIITLTLTLTDFVAELQEVMEGAEARLRVLREQHERRSLELHQQELALTQELEAMGRGFEGPVPQPQPQP